MDVALLLNRRLRRFKRLVRHQNQPIGIRNQRIPRNPRLLLVSLGKSAVNDHDLAAALHWVLPVLTLDRDMAVDDMSVFLRQPEFLQNSVHHVLLFQKAVIRILLLLMGLLLRKEIPLKSRHLILPE